MRKSVSTLFLDNYISEKKNLQTFDLLDAIVKVV